MSIPSIKANSPDDEAVDVVIDLDLLRRPGSDLTVYPLVSDVQSAGGRIVFVARDASPRCQTWPKLMTDSSPAITSLAFGLLSRHSAKKIMQFARMACSQTLDIGYRPEAVDHEGSVITCARQTEQVDGDLFLPDMLECLKVLKDAIPSYARSYMFLGTLATVDDVLWLAGSMFAYAVMGSSAEYLVETLRLTRRTILELLVDTTTVVWDNETKKMQISFTQHAVAVLALVDPSFDRNELAKDVTAALLDTESFLRVVPLDGGEFTALSGSADETPQAWLNKGEDITVEYTCGTTNQLVFTSSDRGEGLDPGEHPATLSNFSQSALDVLAAMRGAKEIEECIGLEDTTSPVYGCALLGLLTQGFYTQSPINSELVVRSCEDDAIPGLTRTRIGFTDAAEGIQQIAVPALGKKDVAATVREKIRERYVGAFEAAKEQGLTVRSGKQTFVILSPVEDFAISCCTPESLTSLDWGGSILEKVAGSGPLHRAKTLVVWDATMKLTNPTQLGYLFEYNGGFYTLTKLGSMLCNEWAHCRDKFIARGRSLDNMKTSDDVVEKSWWWLFVLIAGLIVVGTLVAVLVTRKKDSIRNNSQIEASVAIAPEAPAPNSDIVVLD